MIVRRARDGVFLATALFVTAVCIRLAKPILAPVLLAALIATVTAPWVMWLKRRGLPTIVAVMLGLAVDALAVGGIGLVVGGAVANLSQRQAFYLERFGVLLDETRTWLFGHGIEVSQSSLQNFVHPEMLVDILGEGVQRAAGLVSQFVLVLFIVAFMLAEATTLRSKIAVVVRDGDELDAVHEVGLELKSFLIVKLGTSATTAVLAGLLCYVLDVDLPLLWALLAFLLNFIPTVGSIIAAIPPMLLALVLHGPGPALVVGGGYLVINAIIGSMLEPRLMGNALGLSPLVVFLSMLFWGFLLGVIGALLSPTLTMFLKSWLERTQDMRWLAVLMGPPPADPNGVKSQAKVASDENETLVSGDDLG